jgi:type IV pilus biogenesis protein CpaD/CtpE
MKEERKRILDMLAEGQIEVEEAEDLLAALEEEGKEDTSSPAEKEASFLRIKVSEGGENKVNVNIPLSVARFAAGFLSDKQREKLAEKGVDIDRILDEVKAGADEGKIEDINDGTDKVEVVIE